MRSTIPGLAMIWELAFCIEVFFFIELYEKNSV